MPCGCSNVNASAMRDQAAVCHFCPIAEHAPNAFVTGAVACTIGGRIAVECPRKYFDGSGVVRWLGVRWYGLPYPLRLMLWAFHPKHPRPSSYSGCGCLVWARDLWERAVSSSKVP